MEKQYIEENDFNNDMYTYNQTNNSIDEYYGNLLFFCVCIIFGSSAISCSKGVLDNLYKKYKTNQSLSERIHISEIDDSCCPICLEEYDNNKKIIKLNCNHIFHESCIKEWFVEKDNCPNCRKIII